MIFKIEDSPIYQSLRYQEGPIYKLAALILPIVLGSIPPLSTAAVFLKQPIFFLLLAIMLGLLIPLLYFRLAFYEKVPSITLSEWQRSPETINLALTLGYSAVQAIVMGQRAAKRQRKPFSAYFLLKGCFEPLEGKELFFRLGIAKVENYVVPIGQAAEAAAEIEKIMGVAANFAAKTGGTYIETEDLIAGTFAVSGQFKQEITEAGLDDKSVADISLWQKRARRHREKPPFWLQSVVGGVGQDWAYGYTPLLQHYALNLTRVALATGTHVEIFSRTSIVETVERILAGSGNNNVVLVGEHGVGKKTVVQALARKILDGQIHPALRYKQVMQINVGRLLAGGMGRGEVIARIEGLLQETTRAGNIILFFEDFHTLISSQESTGSVNAAEIFLPYLQGNRLQVIATTTNNDYHQHIEASSGVAQAFERVDVPEPSDEEALSIMEETIPYLENRYGVLFTYAALREIVALGERYMHDKPFPQKGLDIADEVAVKVSSSHQLVITKEAVDALVSSRTNIPVGEVQSGEKEKLLHLEEILHQRVVGQEEAIQAVANALRRARSGLASKNRPLGTFLFLGPTGVGKTETAKALAEAYFGSQERMIRFDMSEYQDGASVYRLIGSPVVAGAQPQPGLLTTSVHDNPFSLLLLDELEKAHPNILTLFLQVMDDGRLTGSDGKLIDFTNAIIIATSNAGSELIREYLQKSQKTEMEELKKMLLEFLQQRGIYRPEFLNRFDGVIAFRPLNQEEITQITGLMINDLNKQLAEKGISVSLTQDALDYLVQKGYDPVMGARPMRRMIQGSVENVLAKKMLSTKMDRGTIITLSANDIMPASSLDQKAKTV